MRFLAAALMLTLTASAQSWIPQTSNTTAYFEGTYFLGDHAIKGGIDYAKYDIFNVFLQDFYGQYEYAEPFGTVNNKDMNDFHEKFKGNAPISFRYGYPDNKSHGHIVVTHKPGVVGSKP